MQTIDMIGLGAMLGSTLSLLPQVIKVYCSKSAKDISLLSAANFLISGILWIAYGVMAHAWSIWLTNIFVSGFAIVLLYLKLSLDRAKPQASCRVNVNNCPSAVKSSDS